MSVGICYVVSRFVLFRVLKSDMRRKPSADLVVRRRSSPKELGSFEETEMFHLKVSELFASKTVTEGVQPASFVDYPMPVHRRCQHGCLISTSGSSQTLPSAVNVPAVTYVLQYASSCTSTTT